MENTRVGPFLILKRLGSNRRQKVYHARQVQQDIDVALKFVAVPPEVDRDVALEKLKIESNFLKRLSHPNLVQFLGCGVEDDQIFFCYELIDGESLSTLLSRRGRMAPDQVVEFGQRVAEVLDYLHSNEVIHSKLTADKILVDKAGEIHVTDLRLNRSRKRRWDAARKRVLDLAAYMAPEQFISGATEKSDIYALGVILYEMLTGQLPYEPDTMGRMTRKKLAQEAPSASAIVMNCPIWLDKLLRNMLAPDPQRRPHTAKAVALAFDEIRKMDVTRKAAVSQVTGNFNPLTAGADKTEANKLLGIKKKKKDKGPFYQQAWFLAACLVLIACIFGFALTPTSSEKIHARASQYLQSDSPADWRQAREEIKTVIERGERDELFDEAETLYYEAMRKTLVLQAEKGQILTIQSPQTRRFGEAVVFEQEQQIEEAIDIYESIVEEVSVSGKERHLHFESESRLKSIFQSRGMLSVDELRLSIEQLSENGQEADVVTQSLTQLIERYSGYEWYSELVSKAQTMLEQQKATDSN